MSALDSLVVTTSLPVLRVSLHANLSSLEWTVNAYNLSFACLLLTGAALGDRFGRRRMFTIGVGVFSAASALSALSPSVGALIAARAFQGAGAALVTPLTLTLISEAFPTEKRGVAIGLWGGITGLAVAAGPVVGGAIAGGINWHWIFWLNIPIGLALMPIAARRLTESFGPRPQLDLAGLALAGAGALSERSGTRPFMATGPALQTIGLAWIALIAKPGMGYTELGLALTVAGVGISMCFPTVATAVMSSVPLPEAGIASGTNSMLRE